MKLLTYIHSGKQKCGVMYGGDERVYSFETLGLEFKSMLDFIENHSPAQIELISTMIKKGSAYGIPFDEIKLCAPIPNPRRDFLCVGQNYIAHARESALFGGSAYVPPEYPVFFSKRVLAAVATEGEIPIHADITSKLDYEAELAVIIGKTCSHVAKSDVYDHIFGYTIVNDVSARDIQNNHKQYTFGKSLDGFAPMGPFIVTADEIGDPANLSIKSMVNGELRQSDNTSGTIFSIPELIHTLSKGLTLVPGDILITGTPAGVGMGFNPPRFLKSGDVVECEIERIGILRNTVK